MKCRSFMKRDAGPGRHTVTSDASGSWGCGAFLEREWFQLRWPEATRELQGTSANRIGCCGLGKRIVILYCNNAEVVAIINKGDSKEMRCLAFLKAVFSG